MPLGIAGRGDDHNATCRRNFPGFTRIYAVYDHGVGRLSVSGVDRLAVFRLRHLAKLSRLTANGAPADLFNAHAALRHVRGDGGLLL